MQKADGNKVLLVDSEPDRKQRISLLKENGWMVYPALDLQQARERCKPGSYDLIVVNGRGKAQAALAICDEILGKDREQLVLLLTDPDVQLPHRDYLVSGTSEELTKKIKSLLGSHQKPAAKSLVA